MSMDRFIAVVALALGMVGVASQYTQDSLYLFIIFCGVFIFTCLLCYLEHFLKGYPVEFVNKCLYYFGKNKENYIIEYEEACYTYKSLSEMEYYKYGDVVSKVNGLDRIEEKFSWSSYSNGIRVEPYVEGQSIYFLPKRNMWTLFEIEFSKRIRKREKNTTGFRIEGLKDSLGLSRPFLALSTERKVKERKLRVIIPKSLRPCNARFETYYAAPAGKILKSVPLSYDDTIGGYQATVNYPRIGWTYSILWDWELPVYFKE